jgi:hypothetical protein
MWEAIQYVSGWGSLVAFVVAGVATVLSRMIRQRGNLIELAPEASRPELVRNALEWFHVDTSKLSHQAQYDLALRQIEERARRFKYTAIVIVVLAVVLAIAFLVATRDVGSKPNPMSQAPAPAKADESPTNVYKTCRHPDFGREEWGRTEVASKSSGRRGGGYNQPSWCEDVKSWFVSSRSIGPQHEISVVSSGESSDKDWKGHVTYNYTCTIRVNWDPIWAEKQDPRCGILK